ncbi:MAG: hypothetical protein ACRDFY_04420 [Candidatus Limnocylindria bacterium]
MAHARQAERAFPQAAMYFLAAVIATILVSGTMVFTGIDPFGVLRPAVEAPNVDPALRDAEARWELHRKLQNGTLEPLQQAEREWERQRREQSPSY